MYLDVIKKLNSFLLGTSCLYIGVSNYDFQTAGEEALESGRKQSE
jgi:hypothetical protein